MQSAVHNEVCISQGSVKGKKYCTLLPGILVIFIVVYNFCNSVNLFFIATRFSTNCIKLNKPQNISTSTSADVDTK